MLTIFTNVNHLITCTNFLSGLSTHESHIAFINKFAQTVDLSLNEDKRYELTFDFESKKEFRFEIVIIYLLKWLLELSYPPLLAKK